MDTGLEFQTSDIHKGFIDECHGNVTVENRHGYSAEKSFEIPANMTFTKKKKKYNKIK